MGLVEEDVVVDSVKNDLRIKAAPSSDLPYDGWRGKRLSPAGCTKVSRILVACKEACEGDHLGTLATLNDGLVDDEVRRVACTSMGNLENG